MFRHLINTIDYKKLIEMQANQTRTSIEKGSFKPATKTKTRSHGPRVKRAAHNN